MLSDDLSDLYGPYSVKPSQPSGADNATVPNTNIPFAGKIFFLT